MDPFDYEPQYYTTSVLTRDQFIVTHFKALFHFQYGNEQIPIGINLKIRGNDETPDSDVLTYIYFSDEFTITLYNTQPFIKMIHLDDACMYILK